MNEARQRPSLRSQVLIVLFAAATFLAGCISPPHLMDDVDATQGEIAKTMLRTGDWVTARLDGIAYLEKAPFKYWTTASLYAVFGVHDWVARMPSAIAVILLCLLVYRMGVWAGNERAGWYAGLVLATSVGLFLFTRIVIPDIILTLAIAVAVSSFLRALEEESEPRRFRWAALCYFSIAVGVLLKGLIGIVFPVGICLLYLVFTRQLLSRSVWRRLYVGRGLLLFLAVAAPWHVLAILRNPPYFDWTLHADPHFGQKFHGFFWFYFINDQLLRFTNGRWPRDYNTVPRLWFWLYHLVWFFPWAFFLVGLRGLRPDASARAARLRLLCLIWITLVMAFFTLSTTQEYYSMPIYPALALLIGWAMDSDTTLLRRTARVVSLMTGLAAAVCFFLLVRSRNLPTPGDISVALSQNPDVYTLALGHMTDLTFAAFAYLRLPLGLAGLAFLVGSIGLWLGTKARVYLAVALMLGLFFQAARLALVTFDPYLSSYPIAEALQRLPRGRLIFNGQYYAFSSIPFYTDQQPLLLNGRVNNLEYGSYAPNAPQIFLDNSDFVRMWSRPTRTYVITYEQDRPMLERLIGADRLILITKSGGKQLLTNQPLKASSALATSSRRETGS